jgi:hypothetical protein
MTNSQTFRILYLIRKFLQNGAHFCLITVLKDVFVLYEQFELEHCTIAEFIDPWLGDKVNSCIRLSYRPASPCILAGRGTTTLSRSWLYLPSQLQYALFVREKSIQLWTCGSFKSANYKKDWVQIADVKKWHISGRSANLTCSQICRLWMAHLW